MSQDLGSARSVLPSWFFIAAIGCAVPQALGDDALADNALVDNSGTARDERAILEEVTRKLLDEQFLGEVAIAVATCEGTVWLSGHAARDEDRKRALELAGSVSGVRTVEDDLCILEVDPCCFPPDVPGQEALGIGEHHLAGLCRQGT